MTPKTKTLTELVKEGFKLIGVIPPVYAKIVGDEAEVYQFLRRVREEDIFERIHLGHKKYVENLLRD